MSQKLQAIYIKPDYSGSFKTRIIYQNYFTGQDGYFEEAIFSAFRITDVDLDTFYRKQLWKRKKFDIFIFNYKAMGNNKLEQRDNIIRDAASRMKHIPKVLFVGSARAEDIPDNEIFDVFDAVFKREHFKDVNRYNLSEQNKQKLHTTILSCPFSVSPRNIFAKLFVPFLRPSLPPYKKNKQYDIFFSGARVRRNNIRAQVLQKLKEGFKIYGGLQVQPDAPEPPPNLIFPKLNKKQYINAMRNAKINLALEGIGEFTFRHLEIWCLGEFMISTSSIKELALPLPAEEDIHYVSYNSFEELAEKVRFYLNNEDARHKITLAGKKMFNEYYNPRQHGSEIRQVIEKIL